MAMEWLLILQLLLPSFGGPVEIRIQTVSEEGCLKFRSAIRKQFAELLIPDSGLGECRPIKD